MLILTPGKAMIPIGISEFSLGFWLLAIASLLGTFSLCLIFIYEGRRQAQTGQPSQDAMEPVVMSVVIAICMTLTVLLIRL